MPSDETHAIVVLSDDDWPTYVYGPFTEAGAHAIADGMTRGIVVPIRVDPPETGGS